MSSEQISSEQSEEKRETVMTKKMFDNIIGNNVNRNQSILRKSNKNDEISPSLINSRAMKKYNQHN